MPGAIQAIEGWITRNEQNYVCVTPAHGVMECLSDPHLRDIFNKSGLTTPDGMAIVWLLQIKGYRDVRRVYGPDLVAAICEYSLTRGWRHFFYGGAPQVAEKLVERLHLNFPGITIAGTYTPPFRMLTFEEDQAIIEHINALQPDIVWIGIGSPKQERWMAEHLGRVQAPVMIGVGAAFDFIAGEKKQAPYFMQRLGLEWFFRFITEPRRLWRRYIQYPRFVLLAIGQLLGVLDYPSESTR
jgi:N-acetylglucosaminyldiphosphoundecaprenol N-acetyl-beta-D-mannosaminyltransferase